jgi:hypothetical protein
MSRYNQKHLREMRRATRRFISNRQTPHAFQWPDIRWDIVCLVLVLINIL